MSALSFKTVTKIKNMTSKKKHSNRGLKTVEELEEDSMPNAHKITEAKLRQLSPAKSQRSSKSSNSDIKSRASSVKSRSSVMSVLRKRQSSRMLIEKRPLPVINTNNNSELNELKKVDFDYEKIVPTQASLSGLVYSNDLEKYLITRIFSNVNNLHCYLNEMTPTNLKFFLNTPDTNECLPLYYAIKASCLNSIKLLLEKGALTQRTTAAGDPALHLACLLNSSLAVIDYLIDYESDMNSKHLYKEDQEGWTCFHCCCNQGNLLIVQHLIEKRFIDPNIKDRLSQHTGLQLAVMNNRIDVVKYLITMKTLGSIKTNSNDQDQNEDIKQLKSNSIAPSHSPQLAKVSILSKSTEPPPLNTDSLNVEPKLGKRKLKRVSIHPSKIGEVNNNIDIIPPVILIINSDESNVHSQNSGDISLLNDSTQRPSIIEQKPKITRPKFHINQINYSLKDNFKLTSIDKQTIHSNYNRIININSQNNEGHNVLHLACLHGRFEIISLVSQLFNIRNLTNLN
jgi:ankyrin repeat protein